VPSDAAKESWFAARGNLKMKLQGSGLSSRQILQSQISLNGKNRLQVNRLAVVHGRLLLRSDAGRLFATQTYIAYQNATSKPNNKATIANTFPKFNRADIHNI
jgi:hypothetical protein